MIELPGNEDEKAQTGSVNITLVGNDGAAAEKVTMRHRLIRSMLIITVIFVLLGSAGCGSSAPAETPAPAETETPAAETAAPVESSAPEASSTPVPTGTPVATLPDAGLKQYQDTGSDAESRFELARTFIDKPFSELQAEIGEPKDSTYVSSCLIPGGQDGELHYDGFTVYTVQTADSETVLDVIAD